MLKPRWVLGNVIILLSCIALSQPFFFGNEKDKNENLFGSIFDGIKEEITNIFEGVMKWKHDAFEKLDSKAPGFACALRMLDPEWLTGINLSGFLGDMKKALKEKNERQWGLSLGKLFNVPLIVEEIKTAKISKASCLGCKFLMKLAKFMIFIGKTDKEIAEAATVICTALGPYFEANDPSVCKGLMKSMGRDAIYAIRYSNMWPRQLCRQFLGEECLCGHDPRHDWKLQLPPRTIKSSRHIITPPPENAPRYKVLQLTDIHHDPYYQEGAGFKCDFPACCRASTGWAKSESTAAGHWGSYENCDSPKRLIENLLQHIVDEHKDLDYIIWTGDIPPHDIWNQSRQANIENLRVTSKLLQTYLNEYTILPAVGNHESFPIDSFVPPTLQPLRNMSYLYDELAEAWKEWLPEEALQTVRLGGYYSYMVKPGLRVISVNGNYCERTNFLLMIDSYDPLGQLAWLIRELEKAEENGEKVHLINHVPPGQPDCLKTWSKNYYDIVNRFEGIIMAQFSGHTHYDEYEVFYDTEEFRRPTGVVYIAPSVTPWENCDPAYRIYYVDASQNSPTTGAVIDFETWKMDLGKANAIGGVPRWYKSYEARSEYNMKSLLPKDWDDLLQRMGNNRTLFDLYHKNYYRDTPTMPTCDDNCKRDKLCDLRSARSHDQRNLCRNI